MIATHIDAHPKALTEEQVEFFNHEYVSTFGRILTDEELSALRFAYERVWADHLVPPDREESAIPGHPSVTMEEFYHETPFTELVANDNILMLASQVLRVKPTDLVYVGGYLHWQRLQLDWNYSDWFWDGWHVDWQPNLHPLTHVNVWVYLDDCTREEGATQVLLGSCEKMRENLRAGLTEQDQWAENSVHTGIREMMDTVGDDPEKGTWGEAPAGGGTLWTSYLWHRIAPNHSGVRRRLVTLEYDIRGVGDDLPPNGTRVPVSLIDERMTQEQRREMAGMLPEDKRYLIPVE